MAEYGGGDLLVLSQAKLINSYKLSNNEYNDVDVDSLICNDKNCAIHNGKQSSTSFIKATLNRNSIKRINSGVYNKIEEAIIDSHLDYKSGAVYDGKVCDNLKFGKGTFIWPNGDKYIGEFKLNYRHGFGNQLWSDGSFYEGFFMEDKRDGHGLHRWSSGDVTFICYF